MELRGHRVPMAFSLLVWFVIWEVAGQLELVSLLPPFSDVLGALPEVVSSETFAEAAWITLKAFVIGMALAFTVGIGVGILMGTSRAVGSLMGMWVNIFESSPLPRSSPRSWRCSASDCRR
jgi:NitT/TauT family transport system permease protein